MFLNHIAAMGVMDHGSKQTICQPAEDQKSVWLQCSPCWALCCCHWVQQGLLGRLHDRCQKVLPAQKYTGITLSISDVVARMHHSNIILVCISGHTCGLCCVAAGRTVISKGNCVAVFNSSSPGAGKGGANPLSGSKHPARVVENFTQAAKLSYVNVRLATSLV